MKKFITLLLVLTGMVSTAMATEYTVIIKPNSNWASDNAWFALYMEPNTGVGTKVAFTETSTGSGYYKATYNSSYDKKIQVCRMNPASESLENSNVWNWSADLGKPSSDVFYDFSSSSTTSDKSEGWNNLYIAPQSLHSSWLLAANRHITNDYKDWQGDASESANNVMTSTDGINYTVTVSNKPIKAGWYGYKFVGDTWYGDKGNNYYVEIANDDFYDITFTFNRISKTGSAVATAKSQSPTITYSYYIYDSDANQWKYDDTHYITAFTGKTWPECEMTNVNGTYVYAIAGKALTSGKRYGSRLLEIVRATDKADQYNWLWIGDAAGGSQGCRYYDCTETGTYNIVFTYKPSDSNYDLTSAQPKLSVTKGFYAAISDDWSLGSAMTFDTSDGLYKYNFRNINAKYFILSTNLDVTESWDSYAIRPESGSTGSYDINAFQVYSGTGVTGSGNGKTWLVNGSGIDNIEITFRPSDYHWEVQPYRTATIGAAGYITYSNGEKCTVSGAEAIYVVSENNTNSVHLEEKAASTVWPENEGMLLKGDNGDEITINAVAYGTTATTIGDNYLVGSGNSEIPITVVDGHYILNWDGSEPSTVGFYSVKIPGNLGAHKAYLDITGTPAREFLDFDFGNGTTGINTLNANQKILNGEFYNLAGQRVAQPTKGLYIVNGKKVIFK